MTTITPHSRAELRQWLSLNAATATEVYVHCIRRQHPTLLAYLDVVEEALCFGWIDSTTRSLPDSDGYLQRLSPRRKGSYWTELNKERCRRLIRLGLMTDAGRAVLPPLDEPFQPAQWIIDAIKADPVAWENHQHFHPLYIRVRLYNIQWYKERRMDDKALSMLQHYVSTAHDNVMYGSWNDNGRLLQD